MKAGWKTVKLGEAAKIISGRNQREVESPNGPHPIIGSGGEMGRANETLCPADTTVIGRKGSINRPFFMSEPFWNVDTAFGISADRGVITPRFLHYFCLSFDFTTLNKGTTIPSLVKSDIAEILIPLPPLAEQKRIVALLDEAFVGIDAAKAKVEDNALGAKRAFQSILETLLSPTATGWTERKLDDLCVIKGRIGYRGYTKNDLVEKGHGAITLSPSNIKQNRFVADDCTYISWFKYDESPEIMVFEGDILFVKTGSTYGKVAIARDLPEKATINPQFVVLKEMKCNNWFLYYSMTTNSFRGGVECIVGGAATPTISQANLGELTIHVPSIGTQETIVKQLDAAHEAATLLGALYEQKVTALNELKSSLLTQAFAGELTA